MCKSGERWRVSGVEWSMVCLDVSDEGWSAHGYE